MSAGGRAVERGWGDRGGVKGEMELGAGAGGGGEGELLTPQGDWVRHPGSPHHRDW